MEWTWISKIGPALQTIVRTIQLDSFPTTALKSLGDHGYYVWKDIIYACNQSKSDYVRLRIDAPTQYDGISLGDFVAPAEIVERYKEENNSDTTDEMKQQSTNYNTTQNRAHTHSLSSHPKHRLDVYIPDGTIIPFPRARRPIVLFVHGGAWAYGDRQHRFNTYGNVGVALARAGFVTAVMSYRLAPQVFVWDQLRDVAAAASFMCMHAGQFGGDSRRLALVGHSSGAHLALTTALSQEQFLYPAMQVSQNYMQMNDDLGINCLIGMSGVYNIPRLGATPLGPTLVNTAFGDDPEVWRAFSPVHMVETRSRSNFQQSTLPCPMLLMNAEDDLHLEQDTEEFVHRALVNNENTHERISNTKEQKQFIMQSPHCDTELTTSDQVNISSTSETIKTPQNDNTTTSINDWLNGLPMHLTNAISSKWNADRPLTSCAEIVNLFVQYSSTVPQTQQTMQTDSIEMKSTITKTDQMPSTNTCNENRCDQTVPVTSSAQAGIPEQTHKQGDTKRQQTIKPSLSKLILKDYNHMTLVGNIGQPNDICSQILSQYLKDKL